MPRYQDHRDKIQTFPCTFNKDWTSVGYTLPSGSIVYLHHYRDESIADHLVDLLKAGWEYKQATEHIAQLLTD